MAREGSSEAAREEASRFFPLGRIAGGTPCPRCTGRWPIGSSRQPYERSYACFRHYAVIHSCFDKAVLGRETKIRANAYGQSLNIIDPANRTTTLAYTTNVSEAPLPTAILYPSGTADSIWYVTGTPLVAKQQFGGDSLVQFKYGAKAQIDSVWGPGRTAMHRFLDVATGRVDSVRFASSTQMVAHFRYDTFGRDSIYTDPGTHVTKYYYDSISGNIDSVSTVAGRFTASHFDAYGRDTLARTVGRPAGHIKYDVLNRVVKMWHEGVANDTVITTYDSLYPVRMRAPGGQIYKWEVNALGWTTKRYDSRDTTLFQSFRFDSAGRLTSYTNRRNQRIDMTYDALNRLLTRTVGSSAPADTFGYSLDGLRQWSIRKNVSRDSIYMSPVGRPDSIVRKIAGHRYAITYSYADYNNGTRQTIGITTDAGINFVQETDAITSVYSGLDSVTITGGPGAGTSTLFHDQDGILNNTHWPNDNNYYYLWLHTALHQTYFQNFPLSTNHTLVDSLARIYTYDSTSRVAEDRRWVNTTTNTILHRQFAYDALGQLLKVGVASDSNCTAVLDTLAAGYQYTCTVSHPLAVQDSATYDAAGNRLFPGAVYSATGNRLLQGPSGWTYTYDADGNLVTRTHNGITDSLFWSATGLLDSVASPGLRRWYEYNAYGQLVRRRSKVGTGSYVVDRHLVWDDTHLLAELDDPGTHRRAQYVYYKGVDEPFALITDSASTSLVRYFFQDPVEGNLTGITRNSTTLQQYSTYSAWGLLLARPINIVADTNRLGWKGLLYEGDSTRLYYVRNRWYDPATGRFVSEDPIDVEGGLNLYAFAGNDPINGRDPYGFDGCDPTEAGRCVDNPNGPVWAHDPYAKWRNDGMSSGGDGGPNVGSWGAGGDPLGRGGIAPLDSLNHKPYPYKKVKQCPPELTDSRYMPAVNDLFKPGHSPEEAVSIFIGDGQTIVTYHNIGTCSSVSGIWNPGTYMVFHSHTCTGEKAPSGGVYAQGPDFSDVAAVDSSGIMGGIISKDSLFLIRPHAGAVGCKR